MADRIPVAKALWCIAETVEENVMLLGVCLQRLGQGQHGEAFALTERGDAPVGIKEIIDTEPPLKA
jgi:hypothetical protein